MYDDIIFVEEEMVNVIREYGAALETLNSIERIFAQIDVHLGNDLWAGRSQQRCVHVHDAIKQYFAMIRPICSELHSSIDYLISDAEAFDSSSNNVNSIRHI